MINPAVPWFNSLVLIRGAGDLATGAAYRLRKAGFPVIMTELPVPLSVRLTVAFSSCVRNHTVMIEGVLGRLSSLDRLEEAHAWAVQGIVTVLVDPEGDSIRRLRPAVVVDARVAKTKLDTSLHDAPLVVALGPGFNAGVDCHAVVETNRGHHLGRVYWQGSAEPNTGTPAHVKGIGGDRVLRAPTDGIMTQIKVIGCRVQAGDLVARIDQTPVIAPFEGVLRGLIDDDTVVSAGMKIGDLDPRAHRQHCFTISDKSLAVGGGVVEAVLSAFAHGGMVHQEVDSQQLDSTQAKRGAKNA
ncbi:hypothetical protein ANRL4_02314 [Anaerolineae bacterium]|nr:hypothetical protein ANRL4_02314 [Anaerolineae bacterium]